MTADELIAYISGAVSATIPSSDRTINTIRSVLNRYYSEKDDDARDRYMRKTLPDDMQKAAPHIPSIIPYKTNPPITPPTWPNHVQDKFWLNGMPMANTGDYR